MKKAIAWGVGIVIGVPVVLAATAAILVNTIDQQALLNKASAVVKEKQQRDLAFTGPVQLKWFPSIGADLNGVTLSEFQSTDQFLKADKVSISLALLPLLSSEVVVDAVQASGVTVNVVKNADGKFNFDDLSNPETTDQVEQEMEDAPAEGGQAVNFSVDSIALENLNVTYADKQTGLEASLNNFAMQSGRIEQGVPTDIALKGNVKANKPQADLNVDLNTRLEFGLGENLYANFENLKFAVLGQLDQQQADVNVQASTLNVNPNTLEVKAQSLDAKAKGQLPNVGAFDVSLSSPSLELSDTVARGEAFNFKADLKQPTRSINATLDLTGLQGNLKQAVSAALNTTVNMVEGERTVNLKLASPMSLNMKSQLIELAALTGQLDVKDPALPKKEASMPLAGRLVVNNTEKTAELDLNSKFEATSFDLKAAVKNFTKPAITAVLNADKLDIDALLPPKKAADSTNSGKPAETAKDTPVDLSPLRNLNLDITANIGELKVSNLQAQQVKTKAVARGGKLTISPLDAKLYGGSTSGVITADANLRVAARRLANPKFSNCGQMCIAPDYILVPSDLKDKLIKELIIAIQSFYGADAASSEHYGKIINDKQWLRITSYLSEGEIVYGGKSNREKLFIEPTIMTGIHADAKIMQDEIFGPILPILTYASKEEALAIIQKNPNPLAFYVFTENKTDEQYWLTNVPSGGACVNNATMHKRDEDVEIADLPVLARIYTRIAEGALAG